MITMHGVNLPIREWNIPELIKIDKLTSNLSSDWNKKSLFEIKKQLRDELSELQYYSCSYCKRIITTEIGQSELDHIIPCSEAPAFTFSRANITLTCKRCNHFKSNHNPTKHTPLSQLLSYPNDANNYVWIHPYLHIYEQHIQIIKDCIYTANNNSINGLAVISVCHLDQLQQVISMKKTAIIKKAKNPISALLQLAGEFPDTPSTDLARTLHTDHPQESYEYFLEKLIKLRSDFPINSIKI